MVSDEQIQHKLDTKTKPVGALGQLESLAKLICLVQGTLTPELVKPHILVFAGDHGIAHEGVSAYPQEVTWQMVMNFVSGGAAINVFSKQNGIKLRVVDAGVNYDFPKNLPIIDAKIAKGTRSFLSGSAMTEAQMHDAIGRGEKQVDAVFQSGCNVLGFGEMGIANTSSASVIVSQLAGFPIEEITGRGTGLDDQQLNQKIRVLSKAVSFHGSSDDPHEVLMNFGGYEIAQMVGAMQAAFRNNMLILVDGFIASAAYLVAFKLDRNVSRNAIFCHQSEEQGHQVLLRYLNVNPVLSMNMRLGEGSACALAYPIIESAVRFVNDMASFESAGVSSA